MRFPFYNQHDAMDCGPACLRMIAEHYGRQYPLQWLREHCYANRNGVSMQGISDGAEHIGLRTLGIRTSFERLAKKVILPCVVHWRQDHFVVVYKIKVRRHKDGFKGTVYVADPAYGLVKYSVEEFLDGWLSTKEGREEKGMALMVVPTMNFYEAEFEEETKRHKISWFFSYLGPSVPLVFIIPEKLPVQVHALENKAVLATENEEVKARGPLLQGGSDLGKEVWIKSPENGKIMFSTILIPGNRLVMGENVLSIVILSKTDLFVFCNM